MSRPDRHKKALGAATPRASDNEFHFEEENVMTNNTTVVDMRQFVQAKNGQAFTTSQRVAEAFSKQHKHVLEKVRNLECSDQFLTANFSAVQFDHRGNTYEAYEMTKDGFMFLVMGFTGKKAATIKEGYIAAFNWMAEQLGLDSERLVNSVIGTTELMAIKGVIADKAKLLPKEKQLSFMHTMHHRLHTRFNVPRTELIPHESFADACNFVAAYALEGEWLGKEPETEMNEGDWGNLNALVVHMQAVSKYWHDYKLYDHFSKVGSPVGAKIIDHVKDGFCAASALKRKHGDKMVAAETAIREMYQRILSEQAGRIAV